MAVSKLEFFFSHDCWFLGLSDVHELLIIVALVLAFLEPGSIGSGFGSMLILSTMRSSYMSLGFFRYLQNTMFSFGPIKP